jgi:HK97 family phage portal protein
LEQKRLGYTDSEQLFKQVSTKLDFHVRMGVAASRAELRSDYSIKDYNTWMGAFPSMLDAFPDGITVTERSAQKLATVFTCLNVLGETLGSLPCDVKQYMPTGPQTVYRNPVHRLVHDRPNPYMTAFIFWSTMAKLRKAWGNAYAEIVRDSNFQPTALMILPPNEITIKIDSMGQIIYEHRGRIIAGTNMLHLKNYSMNGLEGVSTIRQNAMSIGLGLKLKEYNSSIVGKRPYGFLTSETRPKDAQAKENMTNAWTRKKDDDTGKPKTHQPDKLGEIPLLYGGLKFVPLTLPADDVAYIESSKLTDQDIYGIFRMLPTFAQNWEKAPYNASEQQDIHFVKYTLADIRDIEQECNEKLFPEANKFQENPLYIKFNLNGLLRGDTKTRKELYQTLINLGVMTPNQAAELEDLPTYPGGNQHYVQGAMVPVDLLREFIMSKTKSNTESSSSPQGEGRDEGDVRAEIMAEIKDLVRGRLNGHYKDVADIFE